MSLRHILYTANSKNKYKIAILIKDLSFNKPEIKKYYIDPLDTVGIPSEDIVVFNLEYTPGNKAPIKLIRNHLTALLAGAKSIGATTLLCADPNYFKTLTGSHKADPHYGYVLPCVIKDYEDINVILSVNYAALFYNPVLQKKLDISLKTLVDHTLRIVIEPGLGIIQSEYYPDSFKDIEYILFQIRKYPKLAIDIETYSLKFNQAKIATISFAWDQHNGISFNVFHTNHGIKVNKIYKALKQFFIHYKGTMIFHGATFDIKVIIFELFMKGYLDTKGMIEGLNIMYRDTHCTKIITYLATNTTAGNKLDLKSNAAEFAGNWAQEDIKDIFLIENPALLRYNLVDSLSTNYVFNKNYPILVKDNQTKIYEEIMRPSMKVVTQMELTGMPMNLKQITKADFTLSKILNNYHNIIDTSLLIHTFESQLKLEALITKNQKLKKKQVTADYFKDLVFNPASNKQTAKLLHESFGLDVIDKTPTGAPSVGADTLKKHLTKLMINYDLTEEDLK